MRSRSRSPRSRASIWVIPRLDDRARRESRLAVASTRRRLERRVAATAKRGWRRLSTVRRLRHRGRVDRARGELALAVDVERGPQARRELVLVVEHPVELFVDLGLHGAELFLQ